MELFPLWATRKGHGKRGEREEGTLQKNSGGKKKDFSAMQLTGTSWESGTIELGKRRGIVLYNWGSGWGKEKEKEKGPDDGVFKGSLATLQFRIT